MANLLSIEEPGQTLAPHEKREVAVGIDLGTTNSLIAIKKGEEDGEVEIIADEKGQLIHPSIVTFTQGKEEKTIHSIKRLMGKSAADINSNNSNLPFKISSNGDETLRLQFFDNHLTPAEISAKILQHLKSLAEKQLGEDVTKAVITVPAYFDEMARNETKNAALLAGLNVLRLINEPTAAAVAYGLEKQAKGTFAIFDLGGGTFDISILKLQKGVFKVIGVSGDANLGGDDFDELIMQRLLTQHSFKDLTIEQIQQLKSLSRNLKEQLTNSVEATVSFELNNKEYTSSLTRQEFNQLIESKVQSTIKITKNLIDDLELDIDDIKGVVLVGGSTRTLLIHEKLKEAFGADKILTDIDPDKVVAIGAAIQAHALTAGSSNLLLDVIPLSLGIETMGGIVEKIIDRNSTIPTSYSKEFTTYIDGQTGIKLHIVQGEREVASDCRSLAHFEIKDIPPLKAGIARVKVTFTIDADGLLTVSAQETITNQIQTIEVKPSYGLDDAQIKEILINSAKNAKDDIQKRLLIEEKVESERNILAIKAALKEDGSLLSQQEIEDIEKQIKSLETQLKTDDQKQIQQEAAKLEKLAKNFAEKKMN
ncbi:MAG: Fe-S protein assembly chaperone HscA, partial [Proteobacteria bacterium]|nr:Fe-S protein assembly chaperone HscA [Pseudomonadota bacterium]